MSVARNVRKIYDAHPYPAVSDSRADPPWCLAPLDWITDLWQPTEPFPARILVAGCGTGAEAFSLRKFFPKSEIVGVDFCEGEIAIARGRQRSQGLRGIRFAVGDLSDRQFGECAGGKFDLITCHGVLAYVPRRRTALRNLADLLKPEGALYLGVNGSAHFSARWRQILPEFGFDIRQMPADKRLAKVVALLDSISGEEVATVARREPSYLPTDLFGPFIRTASLQKLVEDCRSVGLHFWDVYDAHAPFRATVNNESYTALMPRSRATVAQLIDAARPSEFHRMLVGKRPTPAPPWDEPHQLARWRPILAPHLQKHRLPKHRRPWSAMRRLKIKSHLMNTHLELVTKEWIVEVLRQSRGERSLGDILATSHGSIRNPILRKHLYLLHQLYFLNFFRPKQSENR